MEKILKNFAFISALFMSTAYASVDDATVKALIEQVKALTDEVKELKTKVKSFEEKEKHLIKAKDSKSHTFVGKEPKDTNHHSQSTLSSPPPSKIEEDLKEKTTKHKPSKGYFNIPGTNTAIKVGGTIKLDLIQDAGAPSGDSSNLPDLQLRGFNHPTSKYNKFNMHPRQSRVNLASVTGTEIGDIRTMIEFEFFNGNNFTNVRSGPAGTSNYTPRLRHAFADIESGRHTLLFGQTWSNFADTDASGTTVESNGPGAENAGRQAQLRYSFALNDRIKLIAALENPITDYTDNTGTRRDDGSAVAGSDGFQNAPDLTAKLKYTIEDKWHYTIRGLLRQLRIKRNTVSPAVIRSKTAYGLGVSSKLYYQGKSGVYFNLNMGDGIGRYLYDGAGFSAAFDPTTGQFDSQRAWGTVVGIEHYLHEKWRTNFIWSQTIISVADFQRKDVANPVSKRLEQFFWNIIYSPVKDLDIGLEYARFNRKAYARLPNVAAGTNPNGYKIYSGVAHRFQVGLKYKF